MLNSTHWDTQKLGREDRLFTGPLQDFWLGAADQDGCAFATEEPFCSMTCATGLYTLQTQGSKCPGRRAASRHSEMRTIPPAAVAPAY